uniref:ARM repeat N-terminal plant domain-containing protein n=1 Tax=Nelumbo nucifera TaxID=4432 RepID=A0A822ZDD2_NELNU|nr:TPA_asm: hypothetical protein HUJ06_015748 [Nelumbo nucifera]
MDTKKKKKVTTSVEDADVRSDESPCNNPCCFFCIMKESNPSLRRAGIAKCFEEMPHQDDQEQVLVLSGLWTIAMSQPDDPEFPSLGIFECMGSLIHRGVNDRDWLLRDQNIYIPYYAAHVIGSYTMNKVEFAEEAVKSGVISPLMELLRGKISWVEQRVAVRALGHLASYERTFEAVAQHEEEIVQLAMQLASACLDVVYVKFVGVKDRKKRLKYQCDLLTRGVGSLEMENRKAEEWASQLQCWSLYILNCFACKERSLHLICKREFLKDLSEMWGGLVNHSSPAGVGLIRILCYSETGRKRIADSREVIETLCNLSRSSDDWQYMGIDCLLFLLRDPDTRYKVMEMAAMSLADLVELRSLAGRSRVGDPIAEALLLDYKENKSKFKNNKRVERALQEIWDLKVERRKILSEQEVQERRALVSLLKQQGNGRFWSGDIEEAVLKYSEALNLCSLKMKKERIVLYSNRAQCYLLLRNPEPAISDTTRALCLSSPANSHGKSLWRRSQAYDMKGLTKESLMDCIVFVNSCITSEETKRIKVPYYAVRMINKQMNATWLFAGAHSRHSSRNEDRGDDVDDRDDEMMMIKEKKAYLSGLSTIAEEPFMENQRWSRRFGGVRKQRKKGLMSRLTQARIAPQPQSVRNRRKDEY